MKARSRLKTITPESVAPSVPKSAPPVPKTNTYVYTGSGQSHLGERRSERNRLVSTFKLPYIQPYLEHLETLLLSLIFYGLVFLIVTRVAPAQIANLGLAHTYLPFQICLFLANWFGFSFLWLNTRRGYLTALTIQIPIFLKLQMVEVSWQLGLGVVILFVIIELVFSYLELRKKPDANFHQITASRRRRTRA